MQGRLLALLLWLCLGKQSFVSLERAMPSQCKLHYASKRYTSIPFGASDALQGAFVLCAVLGLCMHCLITQREHSDSTVWGTRWRGLDQVGYLGYLLLQGQHSLQEGSNVMLYEPGAPHGQVMEATLQKFSCSLSVICK